MKYFYACIIILFTVFACKNKKSEPTIPVAPRDTTITVTNSYSELFFDSTRLEAFIDSNDVQDSMADRLRSFYNQRNYQFAWFFKEGLADYAPTFISLQNDYIGYSRDSSINNPALTALLDSITIDSTRTIADSIRLRTELLLTRQFFLYTSRAYTGRQSINAKDLGWFIPRRKIDVVTALDSMLKDKGKNLASIEPVNRQYGLLKEYLLKYYAIEKNGAWQTIDALHKSLRLGDSSRVIAQIQKRLSLTGDFKPADTSNHVFDQPLVDAVKNYQHRMGLKEDGVIGPSFVKELNKPIEDRIRQILINMERIRWIPAEPTSDYILVNIPEFRLHVYEQGQYKWNMDVVVGATAHSTVIFNGDMKYIVFSPYWNVPPGILKTEVLPGIAKNKNYLANHNMEWNNGAVRQKPGPKNSLGLVKFLFPNSYNIYLHDTPAKSLFGEDSRAFSHGCIRLAEPKKLAEYLLRNDSTWTLAKITAAMNSGKEKYVTLKQPIPVFIGYFTAWVDRSGNLNFRDDIYKHDAQMAARLFQ